ncbi:MAG TPA: sigma factor, partial [Chloroflexota bacterium]
MDMGADAVVAMYRTALPRVYGYLLPRCGSVSTAEDLTAETFLAAVDASRQGRLPEVSVAW